MIPNWLFFKKQIESLDQFPGDTFGFIYKITHIDTNKVYIGKKSLYHNKKHKLTKKQLSEQPITRGRKSTHEIIQSESDWKTYYGSADEVKQWAKTTPTDKLTRVVLRLCKSSKELTYYETKYLFDYNVLADDKVWVNSNILGKFFPKDLVPQE